MNKHIRHAFSAGVSILVCQLLFGFAVEASTLGGLAAFLILTVLDWRE
jgi:hypothetical protein